MKQYTQREFIRIIQRNGFTYNRHSGDHAIYVRDGKHLSIPQKLNSVIARRLVKENNLVTEFKRKK
jgi:predicted RNA binding protein YcfA (HicA-like mRNA interferase family)